MKSLILHCPLQPGSYKCKMQRGYSTQRQLLVCVCRFLLWPVSSCVGDVYAFQSAGEELLGPGSLAYLAWLPAAVRQEGINTDVIPSSLRWLSPAFFPHVRPTYEPYCTVHTYMIHAMPIDRL